MQTLNKIGELTKVLSVKSETSDAIMHFMRWFVIRQNPLQTLFGQNARPRYGRAKNCFYRLLARSEMNWRILQLSMARRFQSIVRKENAEETEAPKCYIVDDTTVAKTGLHFEGLSRVFDHVLSKCVLGYKLLLLAFFDRHSTYAVDLSMHREAGKKGDFSLSKKERSMQFHKERSESNPDYERFKELDAKKNDNVVKMIERAYKYVLAVKLCINVADTLENLMEGTQTVSELEAILMYTFAHSYLVFLQIQK